MKKNKSIPFVCFPFMGDRIDNAALSTLELIKNLDRLRYKPLVLLHQQGDLAKILNKKRLDYELLEIPALSVNSINITDFLKTTWLIMRFLIKNKLAIIHTNDERLHALWAVPSVLARSRQIWHQHTIFTPTKSIRISSGYAKKILCPSFFIKKAMPPSIYSNTEIIFPLLNTKTPFSRQKEARKKLLKDIKVSKDVFIIGFFDSIADKNDSDMIIETASLIKNDFDKKEIIFLIVSNDNDIDVQTKNIKTIKRKNPIESLISSCDLFISLKENEPLGYDALKAMIVGTPVIATDSGIYEEIITNKETGFLVRANDSKTIAKTAVNLLNNKEKTDKITKSARTWIIKNCDAVKQTNKIMAVYDSISKK